MMLNALSIDVEEYFHASEVQETGLPHDWLALPSRVQKQNSEVLELLAGHQKKATFFVLGWVAKYHPKVVRDIVEAGHEIGCHSFQHQLVYNLTRAQFKADTLLAISAIEDACGVRPRIYRAPSYSITTRSPWALEVLAECGFSHDSSIYPISHDRYGIPGFGRHAQIVETASGPIHEIPIATVRLSKKTVAPVGGGGYLRLLPYRYTAAGVRRNNTRDRQPACIYFHPWELDTGLPRVTRGAIARVRTYGGLGGMKAKINRLLTDFRFSNLTAVYSGRPEGRNEDSEPRVASCFSASAAG